MNISIEEKHLEIVRNILKKFDYNFFVFGSRLNGKNKKFSDLDLLFFENIPNNILLKLEEEFEESDLPFKVDLVDYNKCDDSFRSSIDGKYIPFS